MQLSLVELKLCLCHTAVLSGCTYSVSGSSHWFGAPLDDVVDHTPFWKKHGEITKVDLYFSKADVD